MVLQGAALNLSLYNYERTVVWGSQEPFQENRSVQLALAKA